MKHTIDTISLCLMTVLISTLTVYGAMGVDPFTTSAPLTHQTANR